MALSAEGGGYLEGREAVAYDKEIAARYEGVLTEEKVEEIRRDALRIFGAVDGYGLSRVDFFIEDGTGEVVFNEINTMPGFTSISMYPLLWAARGVPAEQLVERLLELA